jgi:integrase
MAIFKRGRTWWTDFSVNGQRFRQSLQTTDGRKAPGIEKKFIVRAEAGKLMPSGQPFAKLAFGDAADRYLEHRTVEASVCTWRTESDKMKPLRAFFDAMRLSQITGDTIRSYQAQRHALGRHPRTINHETKLLLRVIRRARLSPPDMKLLPVPRTPFRVLTPAEKLSLFQAAASKPEWQIAYCAALLTANGSLRPCEIRAIRWRDVDARERVLMVPFSKTDAGVRVVPLNPEAWSAILAMRARAETCGSEAPDHFVFCRQWPRMDATRPMSSWRSAWRTLRKTAGLPHLRYYALRHQAITEMLEAGVPEGVIREVAGHVDPAMTRWYSHPRLAAKRLAVEALSLGKSGPNDGILDGSYGTNHVTKALPASSDVS